MIWILSIASMTLGGMVYVLWRPESLAMFTWFSALGLGTLVSNMREWAEPFSQAVPAWVYMSVPESLWLFSGCLAIHSLWRDTHAWEQRCWMVVVFLLAACSELGQAAGLVAGVFDPWDLALILAGFGAAQAVAAASERLPRLE